MPKIKKFEELECWQLARVLVKRVYDMTNRGGFKKDYALRDQLRRASISVLNNIVEGFARFSNKEFARFLEIASSSCAEMKSMFYICGDLEYITIDEQKELFAFADKTQSKILAFVRYLRSRA